MTGQLKPGATYIYERSDGRIYAREMGSTERVLIGEEYTLDAHRRRMEIADDWVPIVQAAEQNPALQDALDRAKLIYVLSQKDQPLFHHPV